MRDHLHSQGVNAPTHRAPLIRLLLILECPADQFCRRRLHVAAIDLEISVRIALRAAVLNMLWVKAAHIMFVIFWFAGIFYLPRLFVYHSMATDAIGIERFKVMERKLYRGIMTPAAVIAVLLGLWLLGGVVGYLRARRLAAPEAGAGRSADRLPPLLRPADRARLLETRTRRAIASFGGSMTRHRCCFSAES